MVDGVTPGATMEAELIDYSKDPLEGISIFSRHTSSEVFFAFYRELTNVIAPLPPLTGPSSVVINLPEVSPSWLPSDIPTVTPISHQFTTRNTGPSPAIGSFKH